MHEGREREGLRLDLLSLPQRQWEKVWASFNFSRADTCPRADSMGWLKQMDHLLPPREVSVNGCKMDRQINGGHDYL